ncbi:hypothetical protein ACSBR2_033370 [Camellia fascicularis]
MTLFGKKVICSKYLEGGGGWWPLLVASTRLSMVWRDILGAAGSCPEVVEFFKVNIKLSISDGRRTKFWLDNWVGNGCLKDIFPRLFSVALDKGESVAVINSKRGGNEEWELAFRRTLFQ